MIVYDHNYGSWRDRYDRLNRTNGAYTYSKDICKWHLPVWKELLGPNDSVATCGKVPGATVQYLHERTHDDLSDETKLFVTTYKDLAQSLGRRGLWIPNTIDADGLPEHSGASGWVYYGNVIGHKRDPLRHFGYLKIHTVSGVKDQKEALARVARHKYGIGVGRCALEMMAIGLKVLIFGKDLGGLILSQEDFDKQRSANFNSNVITGVGSLREGIERIEESLNVSPTFQNSMNEIERRIRDGYRISLSPE